MRCTVFSEFPKVLYPKSKVGHPTQTIVLKAHSSIHLYFPEMCINSQLNQRCLILRFKNLVLKDLFLKQVSSLRPESPYTDLKPWVVTAHHFSEFV